MTRPTQGGLRQERKLEGVSNNLANVDTTGFKKDLVTFDNLFRARINKDYSQGTVTQTGNPLDLAISGAGFFKVETDEGIQYTRNGNFYLDNQGVLTDVNANPVMGMAGPIIIDPALGQDPYINEAGQIILNNEVIDTLDIVTFEDLNKLKRSGKNLLSYTGDTADEILPENLRVEQMALEKSNVAVVDEMVKMIDYQRIYETFSKSMMTFDDIDGKSVNEVGKPR